MKNTIDVHVCFSFKGEDHTPSVTLELDSMICESIDVDAMHRPIAQANNIDTYSYLYDAMESCPVVFSNAAGLAADYLEEGKFDLMGFVIAQEEAKTIGQISEVAQSIMGVDDIEAQPELKAALLAAYKVGKESK